MKNILLLAAGLIAVDTFAIINGQPVQPGQLPQVVSFTAHGRCSGVIVGPRVVLTTASCVHKKQDAELYLAGQTFRLHFESIPEFPAREVDLAAGISDRNLPIEPLAIRKSLQAGDTVVLAGYGCADASTPHENATLRFGLNRIASLRPDVFVTNYLQGAAACYGDSGGPALYDDGEQVLVSGIIAFGNLKDTTYSTRLDAPDVRRFLGGFAAAHQVKICGVNDECR